MSLHHSPHHRPHHSPDPTRLPSGLNPGQHGWPVAGWLRNELKGSVRRVGSSKKSWVSAPTKDKGDKDKGKGDKDKGDKDKGDKDKGKGDKDKGGKDMGDKRCAEVTKVVRGDKRCAEVTRESTSKSTVGRDGWTKNTHVDMLRIQIEEAVRRQANTDPHPSTKVLTSLSLNPKPEHSPNSKPILVPIRWRPSWR